MSASNDNVPLLHDGDAYIIYVEVLEKTVIVKSIRRYLDNRNADPTEEDFRDLPPQAKAAVIQQINRRYQGKFVRV